MKMQKKKLKNANSPRISIILVVPEGQEISIQNSILREPLPKTRFNYGNVEKTQRKKLITRELAMF